MHDIVRGKKLLTSFNPAPKAIQQATLFLIFFSLKNIPILKGLYHNKGGKFAGGVEKLLIKVIFLKIPQMS